MTYPGILPQTDVTETATATGLSETLTLHSAQAVMVVPAADHRADPVA